MKKTLGLALSSAALFFLVACNNNNNTTTSTTDTAANTTATTNNNDSKAGFSSAMGTLIGNDFLDMQIGDKINVAEFRSAFESILMNGMPSMDVQQASSIVEPIITAASNKQAIPAIPAEFSKAFGTIVALQLSQSLPAELIDPNVVFPTLEKTLAGTNTITREQAQQSFQNIMMAEMEKQQSQLSAQQGQLEGPGKAFLAENAKNPKVKTTASGLQYEVIKEGKGKKPTLSNKVTVHYHGTLIDGTVFDSSVDRGETIAFQLGQVIQGWQEGLQLMSEGSKYKLYIPHEIGYGGQQAGSIPPFSTLIFEVELFKVE